MDVRMFFGIAVLAVIGIGGLLIGSSNTAAVETAASSPDYPREIELLNAPNLVSSYGWPLFLKRQDPNLRTSLVEVNPDILLRAFDLEGCVVGEYSGSSAFEQVRSLADGTYAVQIWSEDGGELLRWVKLVIRR